MKAALWYDKKDIRVEDIEEPVVSEGKVKVKVKWCGICGSDLHEYLAGPMVIPVDKPHPLTGAVAPVVMGHEYSGEVVEIGDGVTKYKPGDRVVVEPIICCGKCPACKEGKYNHCFMLGAHGLSGFGGGFSEYTVFPEEFVHKLPDNVSYEMGALAEPMSVAQNSIENSKFKVGDTAIVLGAGPIGLATIECLKAAGAKLVVALEMKSIRQEYAKKAGADYVFDSNEFDVPSEVRKLTDGLGADVAFETTGVKIGFDIGLNSLKYEGTMVVTSLWKDSIEFNPMDIVFSEKHIVGTSAYRSNTFSSVLAQMNDGRIKADGYITKKVYIDDIVNEGFETLSGLDKKKHVKIIVTPDKSLIK